MNENGLITNRYSRALYIQDYSMKIDCGHLIAGLGNEYCTLKQDREISPGKKSLFKFQNNCLNHRKIIETIGGI